MNLRLCCLALGALLATSLPAQEIKSPNGNLAVALNLSDGRITYQVTFAGHPVLAPSPLGLETSNGTFSSGLKANGTKTATARDHYELPHGKVRSVDYVANELTASFTNATSDALDVIIRVSDRDVGFAYRISSPEKRRIIVQRETTGFKFPAATMAFVTPQVAGGTGWMGTKPSYEENYLLDVPAGTPAPSGLGFTFPALFHVGSDAWVLVSETGATSNYVGSRLGNPTADGHYPLAFPEAAENGGVGDTTAAAALPLTTPWRTLTVGSTLAPIVESTVATDLVQPLYPASQAYRPGRVSWSWLVWQDASMNEADQRAFIDLAATMGWEYILVDALWDANLGREKIAELVKYARQKNVGVLLWYNSNGTWNDAPQTPKNRMNTAPARQQEMAWLHSIGVAGIKVDFFGGDKQDTMKLYEDILTDANAQGLMAVFHGATVPRGWERIYPNHLSSEAVTASENLIFTQAFADAEAIHSTVFPVTRNAVAAMDYGPVVLNPTFAREPNKGNVRRTTDAFQLATAVIYQSPLQHFGLTPNNVTEQPAFVIDFLKHVPSVWDETRFIDGYPGRFIVLARRAGDRWYLGATNAEKADKEITVSLPFLAGQSLSLITDSDQDKKAAQQRVTVGPNGKLTLHLRSNGGAVAVSGER